METVERNANHQEQIKMNEKRHHDDSLLLHFYSSADVVLFGFCIQSHLECVCLKKPFYISIPKSHSIS